MLHGAELARQSSLARPALDGRDECRRAARVCTVLEQGSRMVSLMSPLRMVLYTADLLERHQRTLQKFWDVLHEQGLVDSFPFSITNHRAAAAAATASVGHSTREESAAAALARTCSNLSAISVPGPLALKLDDCRADSSAIEIAWDPPIPPAAASASSAATPMKSLSASFPASSSAPHLSPPAASPIYFILQMATLDPFDLSRSSSHHQRFVAVFRGLSFSCSRDATGALSFGAGDLSLLDPFDAPLHHFGLESYELDTECDARAGLPP